MKRPILGMAILLAAACAASAQENAAGSATRSFDNVAAPFNETSAAQVTLFNVDASDSATFATPTPAVPAALPAAPKPKPKFVFGDRDDYRWQLYVGVEFYRFLSNIITASLVGTNTTID